MTAHVKVTIGTTEYEGDIAEVVAPPGPVDCVLSAKTYSAWGPCVVGEQSRTWTRTVVTPPSTNPPGMSCGPLTGTETQACVTPPDPGGLPYTLPAPGGITKLGHSLLEVSPTPAQGMAAPEYYLESCRYSFGSGIMNPKYSPYGAFLFWDNGAHGSPDNPGAAGPDYSTGLCIRLDPVGGENKYHSTNSWGITDTDYNPAIPPDSNNYHLIGTNIPAPSHGTQVRSFAPWGPKGTLIRPAGLWVTQQAVGSTAVECFDCATRENFLLPFRMGDVRGYLGNAYAYTVIDEENDIIYWLGSAENNFSNIEYIKRGATPAEAQLLATQPWIGGTPDAWADGSLFFFRGLAIRYSKITGELIAWDRSNPTQKPRVLHLQGDLSYYARNWYVPLNDKLYAVPETFTEVNGDYYHLCRLTPPSGDPFTGMWIADTVGSQPFPNSGVRNGGGAAAYGNLHRIPALNMLGFMGHDGYPVIINPDA